MLDGTPSSQIINEKTLRDVSNAIKNHIEPKIYPEIKIVYLNDRPCAHVKFEGTVVPYYAYGQEDLPMSPQEIKNRYKRKMIVQIYGRIIFQSGMFRRQKMIF